VCKSVLSTVKRMRRKGTDISFLFPDDHEITEEEWLREKTTAFQVQFSSLEASTHSVKEKGTLRENTDNRLTFCKVKLMETSTPSS